MKELVAQAMEEGAVNLSRRSPAAAINMPMR